jgi:uncharacterized protein (TIGR03437 family)
MIRSIAVLLFAAMAAPSAIRVSGIVRVPVKPGQAVVAIASDSRGNTIAAASGGVHKLDPAGNVVFSRELPGVPQDLVLDGNGDIYVAGWTDSTAFPFTHRLYPNAEGRLFAAKLKGTDGALVYATALGAGNIGGIAVDAAGRVFMAGMTGESVPEFIVTPGAYDFHPNRNLMAYTFIAALTPAGETVFTARYGGNRSVCYGGSGCVMNYPQATPNAIALDASGNIYIAGRTNLQDLPTTPGALSTTCGCGNYTYDTYIAKFSPNGRELLYSTYFGSAPPGVSGGPGSDLVEAMVLDAAGDLWIAGSTNGTNFPVTADAPQKEPGNGYYDGFLSKLSVARGALLFSTYMANSVSTLTITAENRLLLSGADSLAVFDPGAKRVADSVPMVNGAAGAGIAPWAGGTQLAGGSSMLTRVQFAPSAAPNLLGVASAAGYIAKGQVAPGELISLYGIGLGGETVEVLVDGESVPLLYTGDGQINAALPFSIAGRGTVRMTVRNRNGASGEALLQVVDAAPEVFTTWVEHRAAALNEDGSVNGPEENQRARRGSIVTIFLTGSGDRIAQLEVLFRSQPLEITYAGPAPGMVAGVSQVNFRLPDEPDPYLSVRIGDWRSESFVILTRR